MSSAIRSAELDAASVQRRWAIVFWGLVTLLMTAAVAAWLAPELRQRVLEGLEAARAPFEAIYLSLVPEALHRMVRKAAAVFLSPWLYLLMVFVLVAERYIPAERRQKAFSLGMVQDFVTWFTLDGLLRTVAVGALVGGLAFLYERYLAFLTVDWATTWPPAVRMIVALLALDLLAWFHHWVRHKVIVFWLFHTIHHSQRELNMFTDLRVHVVEHFIAKPIVYLPLFIFSLNVEWAFWLALLSESHSRIYHANLRTNYGWLRYVLVTPQSHRVHHSRELRHRDKNFGLNFSIWDHLFGTQWRDYDDYPETGIDDPGFPLEQQRGRNVIMNYLLQLAYPFRVLWRGVRGQGWTLEPEAEGPASSPPPPAIITLTPAAHASQMASSAASRERKASRPAIAEVRDAHVVEDSAGRG